MLIAAASHPLIYWYVTRATGIVALCLLTATVVLGVVDVSRFASERWPRFVIDGVHRRVALLSVAFLLIHIVTTVVDGYVPIGWIDAVIPFHSSYRTIWLGLGAVAFDLLIALTLSSLVRARLGYNAWRAIHWLAYACWPIAVAHGAGTGTDFKETWMLAVDAVCVLSVLGAVGMRLSFGGLETSGALR